MRRLPVLKRAAGRAGFYLLISFLFLTGCGKPLQTAYATGETAPFAPAEMHHLSPAGEGLLRSYVDAARLPDLHWPDFQSYREEVREFYDSYDGSLPWFVGAQPGSRARAIVAKLQNAAEKGLRPEDYDASQWGRRLAAFDGASPATEHDFAVFDLALTVSTMRYISDLHLGRVNPHEFHFYLDIGPPQMDLSEFLKQELVAGQDVGAALDSVEPPFPIYRRTEAALKKYMKLEALYGDDPLPVPAHTVKPGDSYSGAPGMARLLILLGDLSESQSDLAATGDIYEGDLVAGVQSFQRRHGLDPTGVIDSATIKELNTPLSHRVMELQLAMERMRWLPHRFDRPPIVVNIPEFRLYALNDEYRSTFSMAVVIGKAYRRQTHTPVFASKIDRVIFRPYWNVPRSILVGEIVPHIDQDQSYLEKNSYEVVDKSTKVVSGGAVTPDIEERLRSGELRVRQVPGDHNALGLIKFNIPSQYDVYMHSTPATKLFGRSRRDFSHGCIRLENPVALANWVLQGVPGWTEDRIRTAMNGADTFEVKIPKPIPVLIYYSTAVVMDGNDIRFLPDLYGYDAILERVLNAGLPYAMASATESSAKRRLPVADAPYVDVHEMRHRVISDAAAVK